MSNYIKQVTVSNGTFDIYDSAALHKISNATNSTATDTAASSLAVKNAYDHADQLIAGLGAILSFKGVKSTAAQVFAVADAKKGDVWLVSEDSSEYVYKNDTAGQIGESNWEKLGTTQDAASSTHKHSVVVTGENTGSPVTINPVTATIGTMNTAGSVTNGSAASYTGHSFTANVPTQVVDSTWAFTYNSTDKELQITGANGSHTNGTAASHNVGTFTANTPTAVTLPTRGTQAVWTGYNSASAAAQTWHQTDAEVSAPIDGEDFIQYNGNDY